MIIEMEGWERGQEEILKNLAMQKDKKALEEVAVLTSVVVDGEKPNSYMRKYIKTIYLSMLILYTDTNIFPIYSFAGEELLACRF